MGRRFRKERDPLGERDVPFDAYYGIQTQRALENFPVTRRTFNTEFIKSYVMIKRSAALANMELRCLDEEKGNAILKACDEILDGKFLEQFVVDVFNAGAGTSFNMNVNEVIANRALEISGREKGDYAFISPNDHVNMAQSTNDTFPTAMHISTLLLLRKFLIALDELIKALEGKGEEFKGIVKSGRTHLQDALPVTLGDEFKSYADTLGRVRKQIEERGKHLNEVALGATAVGTGVNSHPEYRDVVVKRLREITGLELKPAPNPMEAIQSHAIIAGVSSAVKELALELVRIANDLRLLSSGPTTGFGEIELPAVQPGSSIMAGKVNPVMAECLNMIAFQVIGNDLTISLAVQAGQLDLNVMTPVIVHNIHNSIEILTNYLPAFTEKCVRGIKANEERCKSYLDKNPAIATLLIPYIGYLKSAEVAKEALEKGISVKELVLEKGLLSKDAVEKIFRRESLIGGRG